MKASVILWTHYKRKDNLFPVKIRVSSMVDGKPDTRYIPLGIFVSEKQFDDGKVTGHPKKQEYNLKIIKALANAQESEPVDSDKELFSYWSTAYKNHIKAKCGIYHQKKIDTVINKIEEFRPNLRCKQVTDDLLIRFETQLLSNGLHRNYVSDILERFRTIFRKAVKAGVVPYHKDPFNDFKLQMIDTEAKRLTGGEFKLLEDLEQLTPQEQLAVDAYVFSYYHGGMRFGDITRITKENFKGNRFKYTMHKGVHTSNPTMINVPINEKGVERIKKYKYKFPFNVDWDREERSINSKNTLMNKHLKSACKKAKIPEVTFHTARHSVADRAVSKKLSPSQMKSILGHKKLATTETYLKKFYSEVTDDAMDKLFN